MNKNDKPEIAEESQVSPLGILNDRQSMAGLLLELLKLPTAWLAMLIGFSLGFVVFVFVALFLANLVAMRLSGMASL